MRILRKATGPLVILLYAAGMLYATIIGLIQPYRNWDMLGYVGTAISWQEKNPDAIYEKVMATVQENIPDWIFQQFKENPLSADSKAYREQLPFYTIKPLYPALMWAMHQTGMALPVASWTISAFCFALLAVLLFFWRTRYQPRSLWLIMLLGISFLWLFPMASLARLSTPDALCTLLGAGAFYAWVFRKSCLWFMALAWAAALARPDAMIPSGALAVYFVLFSPKDCRMPLLPGLGFVVFLLISNGIVGHLGGGYSFARLFTYGFIDRNPYPAEMPVDLTFAAYWGVLSPSFLLFIAYARVITMAALSLLACFCHYMKPATGNRVWLDLLGVAWACVAMRFLLWPAWGEERYYYGYFLIALFACGELISPYMGTWWEVVQKHGRNIRTA